MSDLGSKMYAENVGANGGGSTGGEPSDSLEEVATGMRDAYGHMIYKKTYVGASAPSNNIIDSTVNQDVIELYDVKGRITDASGGSNTFCSNFGSGYNCNGVKINEHGIYVDFGSYFKSGYYVTIYYTYKSVN